MKLIEKASKCCCEWIQRQIFSNQHWIYVETIYTGILIGSQSSMELYGNWSINYPSSTLHLLKSFSFSLNMSKSVSDHLEPTIFFFYIPWVVDYTIIDTISGLNPFLNHFFMLLWLYPLLLVWYKKSYFRIEQV